MKNLRTVIKLFWTFLKVGSFTFGGGYAMLPLIQKEVVDRLQWVNEEEILDVFAISQSVPGVIGINSAIFIGNRVAGFPGAVAAALGMILPAFLSILLLLLVLQQLKNNIYVEKVFEGIKAASVALILLSAIKLGKGNLKDKLGWFVALAAFVVIIFLHISAAWAVILGGCVGLAGHLWNRVKTRP